MSAELLSFKTSSHRFTRIVAVKVPKEILGFQNAPLYSIWIVDLSKYPLDKLFYFVAGVIPGSLALAIFHSVRPVSFNWLFTLGALGDNAKLAVILVAAFIVGNSLTTFLSALLGGIGGVIGGIISIRPYRPSTSFRTAPWRDSRWRTALKRRLGDQAPGDTSLMPDNIFEGRRKLIERLPTIEQPAALYSLNSEKLQAEMNDLRWQQWYEHYHRIVLKPEDKDMIFHVHSGFNFNMETAALYYLFASVYVPALRHWWCTLPACAWVVLLIVEQYASVQHFTNEWSTLSAQIRYLLEPQSGE